MDALKEKALQYHSLDGVPGKVSVVPTKPCQTAEDFHSAFSVYSHSIVPGGFDVMSYTIRLTPSTSFTTRLEIWPSRS